MTPSQAQASDFTVVTSTPGGGDVDSRFTMAASQGKRSRHKGSGKRPAAVLPKARAGNSLWTQEADSEARNALQVILSGGELLLDDFFGRLSPTQRNILERVMASACHLNQILRTLAEHGDAGAHAPRTGVRLHPRQVQPGDV